MVDHVMRKQSGATACQVGANRLRIAAAVDRVKRIDAILVQTESARAERISGLPCMQRAYLAASGCRLIIS